MALASRLVVLLGVDEGQSETGANRTELPGLGEGGLGCRARNPRV